MAQRLDLHNKLINITGLTNVYFQPPSGVSLSYPCVVYSLEGKTSIFANNFGYTLHDKYLVTVIDSDPDSDISGRLLTSSLPYITFERRFVADGLYHDVHYIFV